MPEGTETVVENPIQEQKTVVRNEPATETNGQPAETGVSSEVVDACTLKSKVASENESVESSACPVKSNNTVEDHSEIEASLNANNSTDSQNGIYSSNENVSQTTNNLPVENDEQSNISFEVPEIIDSASSPPTPVQIEPEEITLTQPEIEITPTESQEFETPVEPDVEITPSPEVPLTNGQSNDEPKVAACILARTPEPEIVPEAEQSEKPKVLNGTIANELKTEDYKLPEVVEVKKHFEYAEPAAQSDAPAPPKKGALMTNLDSASIKSAYEDVRCDGSPTQWAVFKFEGAKIITSATGTDFEQFRNQFGEEERAFGYIRVQTGDEMSKRAKFMLVTWVGPAVSVLKRAKMSTDKALIKGVLSNFAVELQTENIADIDLQNFGNELDKAGGAHYGTGVRG